MVQRNIRTNSNIGVLKDLKEIKHSNAQKNNSKNNQRDNPGENNPIFERGNSNNQRDNQNIKSNFDSYQHQTH